MTDKTQVNVGLPDGKTVKFTLDEEARGGFFGLNVGEEFSGELLGADYADYKLLITGWSASTTSPAKNLTKPSDPGGASLSNVRSTARRCDRAG